MKKTFSRKHIATFLAVVFSLCVFFIALCLIKVPGNITGKSFAGNAAIACVWVAGLFCTLKCSLWIKRRCEIPLTTSGAGTPAPPHVWIFAFAAGLFALLLGKYITPFYFLKWPISFSEPGGNPKALSLLFIALSWVAVPFFVFWNPKCWVPKVLAAGLFISELRSWKLLFKRTGYTTPYSDDHPSFLFRISEFFGSFPWRENFVPYWNAGIVNSVITSSGTPGIAILGAPLFLFMEPHEAMPYVFVFVFIFFIPWMTVWGLRTAGMPPTASLVGGILVFSADHFYFKWLLHFGTVGAMLSGALLPAAFAFLYAALLQPKARFSTYVGLAVSIFFMVQWPPMMLLGLPMGLIVLFHLRRWWPSKRHVPFLLTCIFVFILILPTIAGSILGKSVMGFVLSTDSGAEKGFGAISKVAGAVLHKIVLNINPILLFAGFGGLLVMPSRRLRSGLALALVFVVAVAVLGPVYLPNMQLERMAMEASALMTIPAAYVAGRGLGTYTPRASPAQGVYLAMLVCSLVNTPKFYGARGEVRYYGMQPFVADFTTWITDNVPEDGRLAFAGPAVHAYGWGHTAYLPMLADREMMGCDYYGFPPKMVEYDYPPRSSRAMPGGMHRYMVLRGASHVVAYEKRYIDYFRSKPSLFREVATLSNPAATKNNVFVVFAIIGAEGRFQEGSGEVRATFNKIDVGFNATVPERAVIRYNWNDRLETKPPARIFPVDTGEGVVFIGIEPNGEKNVKIRYRSVF